MFMLATSFLKNANMTYLALSLKSTLTMVALR